MKLDVYKIVPLSSEHIDQVTSLWRVAMSDALGIQPVHSFESQAYFLEHILPDSYTVTVAVSKVTAKPIAFMASSATEVSQLYVALEFQGQGIGSHLLHLAKSQSDGVLTLSTFEVNKKAQRFYSAHGFTFSAGNSENEEGLPDLKCVWKRSI